MVVSILLHLLKVWEIMNKFILIATIVLMASLLGVLVVFEVLTVISNVQTVQSAIDFHDSKGIQVPALVLFHLVVDGYSVPFDHLCQCHVGQYRNPNVHMPCQWLNFRHLFNNFMYKTINKNYEKKNNFLNSVVKMSVVNHIQTLSPDQTAPVQNDLLSDLCAANEIVRCFWAKFW